MKKIVLILISSLFCSIKFVAQEVDLPLYVNHLADNPFLISPTYAGIGTGFQLRLNGVSQWIGLEDAPVTQSVSAEVRLADRFGGGIVIFNDKNGFTSQQGARLSLASHLTLSDFYNSFLSFALTYSYTQFGINTSENNTSEAVPNRFLGNSNFDIGLLYRFERFSISANVINLLDKNIENFTADEPEVLRKYNIYTTYVFTRVSRSIELEPSVLVEYRESDSRSRTDLNLKVRKGIRGGYLWAGLSYTFLNDQIFISNAISPLFGLKKNKLYLSYGFRLNTNKIQNYNYGSHMITLGFDYERRPSLARCTQKMVIF
ncbi:MAG: type IX secretion system membrane protein PorP/SprF [Tenacibaculum sp.]